MYITSFTFINYSNNIINICRFLFVIVLIVVNNVIVPIVFVVIIIIIIIIIITFYIVFFSLLSSSIQCLFDIFYICSSIFLKKFGNASTKMFNGKTANQLLASDC